MRVLIDTCIWSYAFRRNNKSYKKNSLHQGYTKELTELVKESRVEIIGSIRQEVLSGMKHQDQFTKLKNRLSAFPDLQLTENDYELAAEFFNKLRSKGIQGSNTDFLLCAASVNHNLMIFTDDGDFTEFKRYIPVYLHTLR